MKIAMIGHKRIPSKEGGVEVVVEELSTRLVKLGYDVDVYNRKSKHVSDKSIKQESIKQYKGIKILNIPTPNNKTLNAIVYSFFATVIAIFKKYDVIHYHAEGPAVMLIIPHLFRIRTVVTIHGLDWKRSKWGGFATKYLKFGEKIAAKYADEVIVLSKNVQDYFRETYGRETIFIPNGVNKPTIIEPKIIKDKYDLEKDDYILFLARIVPEKGVHYLLEAFKSIDTDKKLVIAGGSSHSEEYFEKIKELAGKDDRVIMTGFVQGNELEELFGNCYLYCLPSDIEGMPLSLLEAMSYGCRCLVSDIEENKEVCENYAETFKKGNIQDLRDKLEKRIKIEKRIGKEEISDYILNKYNWDEVVDKTSKCY
ncbi:MAG: glycosyltransferase family 4 protein [Lachnospiraceae bacterium]|jgi:glycosyltransferase involved in cell wall biosynthesis|nr:glycosyltransferase family 4 protein [Lachnospiraceae bacterium]